MRGCWIGVLVAMGAACGSSAAERSDGITARDSAGIELVEHPDDLLTRLPQWSVDSHSVDIGGSDSLPGHDLHLVRDIERLRDGRIVVANAGSSSLRYYDAAGRFLFEAGRAGNGPGEFGSLGSTQLLAGDSILVFDSQSRRASRFGPDGGFGGSSVSAFIRPGINRIAGYTYAFAGLRDGRLLAESRFSPQDMKETSGPVRRDSFAVVLFRDSAAIDTVAVVPGYEGYPALGREGGHSFPTIRVLEFGRTTSFATDGERIYIGSNEPKGIEVRDGAGRLLRIIRGGLPLEPVTAEHRDTRTQEAIASVDRMRMAEQYKAEWRKAAAEARYAETFPYHERLLIGEDGSLWAERPRRRNDEGRQFVVFDPTGRAIATVSCPERMRPFVVGPEVIIGMWRDEDDVQHVRVYPLRRD